MGRTQWILSFFVAATALSTNCSVDAGYAEHLQELETGNHISYDYAHVEPPSSTQGLLYPRESETREVRSLDGVWSFLKSNMSDPDQGLRERWYAAGISNTEFKLLSMPVPASYNDITVDGELRDHVGTVWYERTFFVPKSWAQGQRTWLRFGSVHYNASVWINARLVINHSIGHLPFEAEIGSYVNYGAENRVTILCDNRLGNHTIPQGQLTKAPSENGIVTLQTYTFDFFNYAGIHRSVHLYTTPRTYISDIAVETQLTDEDMGRIDYLVQLGGYDGDIQPSYLKVQLYSKNGSVVVHQKNRLINKGVLLIPNVRPWWPFLMHSEPGYMYSLELSLIGLNGNAEVLLDVYRLPVGIRTLSWNEHSLMINGEPLYLRGFGKHEDSDIRGKGLDLALLTRDFNLLKWIGANAYRTSHYPYSEESMQFADQQGIMIIDECSSVNADIFEPELLRNHMSALEQLIHRDRNHPSVIAWSIANEPRSAKSASAAYFRALVNYTRSMAPRRPITAAINVVIQQDHLAPYLDIIGFNRYNSWYQNPGRCDMIVPEVYSEAKSWHELYKKPVIMFEYGGDTMEGLHALPAFIWSEDYQTILLSKHFQAFDKLRKLNWFIGEFVWNFADFKTAQTITRVGGNKKGIFSRNRQPKSAAYLLRQRYYTLAMRLNNQTLPDDLFNYIIEWP